MKRALGVVAVLVLAATAASATDPKVTGPEWQALSKSGQTEFIQNTLAKTKARWKADAADQRDEQAKAYDQCFATETFDAAWVERARASITRYYEDPKNSCHEARRAMQRSVDSTCETQINIVLREGRLLLVPPVLPRCAAP